MGTLVAVLGMTTLLGGTARADLVAGWNFNGLDSTSVWLPSNHGDAWIDLGPIHPSSHLYSGTVLNAPSEWRAGEALGFQGSTVESGAMLLGIESGSLDPGFGKPVHLSFAARRSETGFDRVLVESWSGGSWTMVESLDIQTEWSRHEVSPVSIDPLSGLLLRITMEGSASNLGTIRFDNLRIDSTPIPSPATAALVGVGGLVGIGGRRRR